MRRAIELPHGCAVCAVQRAGVSVRCGDHLQLLAVLRCELDLRGLEGGDGSDEVGVGQTAQLCLTPRRG